MSVKGIPLLFIGKKIYDNKYKQCTSQASDVVKQEI